MPKGAFPFQGNNSNIITWIHSKEWVIDQGSLIKWITLLIWTRIFLPNTVTLSSAGDLSSNAHFLPRPSPTLWTQAGQKAMPQPRHSVTPLSTAYTLCGSNQLCCRHIFMSLRYAERGNAVSRWGRWMRMRTVLCSSLHLILSQMSHFNTQRISGKCLKGTWCVHVRCRQRVSVYLVFQQCECVWIFPFLFFAGLEKNSGFCQWPHQRQHFSGLIELWEVVIKQMATHFKALHRCWGLPVLSLNSPRRHCRS